MAVLSGIQACLPPISDKGCIEDMSFRPRAKAPGPDSKVEKAAEAQDLVAAFLAKGGGIKKIEAVTTSTFACANCGHVGIIGAAVGKVRKCPKCREPLP